MKTITVKSGQSYDVIIGSDPSDLNQQLIKKIAPARIVAIFFQPSVEKIAHNLTDKLTACGYAVHTMQLPDAERGKDISTVIAAWDFLGNIALGRTDVVISLGGGAVTDVTGFIASTWLRGVAVIHIPTTLLAMVDAAVGGKTGINTSAGKNLVGTFYEPSAVLIDTTVLTSMAKPDIAAGMAEIIKCGFIADPTILDLIEEDPTDALRTAPEPSRRLIELIERSIQVKADVVTSDFKESHYREILNYGHTLAHAIERREKYQWRHGDAVAVGMVYAAELARISGILDAQTADRHRRIIELVGLPVSYDPDAFPQLLAAMSLDKKTRSGILRFVILDALARPTRLEGPDPEVLIQAYAALHANG